MAIGRRINFSIAAKIELKLVTRYLLENDRHSSSNSVLGNSFKSLVVGTKGGKLSFLPKLQTIFSLSLKLFNPLAFHAG